MVPIAVQVSFDDVHAIFNGFGHHGALGAVAPHTLATLLDGPHSPHYGRTHPTVRLYSNCGSDVLWWGAHHQVHLGATLRLKALPPHLGEDRALHRSPWCTTSLAVGDVHIIIVRRPEPQFEPSNTVLGAPNVVVVVCVCPPKGDQALSCHPWGVGGIAPNAPWRP